MKKLLGAILLVVAVLVVARVGFAVAQDEEQSRLVRFVERQISTPDRQIRLGPIEGALSSDVRIGFITISDRAGVWLRVNQPHLVWSRLALIRGRLDIDLLEAASIEVIRQPLPAETTEPIEESGDFNLPELPVAVLLDRLSVPDVRIADGVIGPAAQLSVGGAITLEDGELDARIGIRRLDRPGDLTLITTFNNASRDLGLTFTLAEPADGVVANSLNIEGSPPIDFAIQGSGPLADWTANITLNADGRPLLAGTSTIMRDAEGLRFQTRVDGNLEPLVASLYDPYVAGGTQLRFDGTRRDDGSFVIREGRLTSGVANLAFAADIGPDGAPRSLTVDGDLTRPAGGTLLLPGGGGDSSLGSATVDVALGGAAGDAFRLDLTLNDLVSPLVSTPQATIRGSGRAANLSDPTTRDVTFDINGGAQGIRSAEDGIADALGSRLEIVARGAWQGAGPIRVDTADLVTDTLSAHFDGTVLGEVDGNFRLEAADLSAFAALTERPLDGSVDLGGSGRASFDGLFDVALDGSVADVALGIPAVDGLLAGTTTVAGRAARTADGVSFDGFRIANPQLSVDADGAVSATAATLTAEARLTDLAAVDPKGSGPIAATLTVSGAPASQTIVARITSPSLNLSGETLETLVAAFDGTLARQSDVPFDLDGQLTVTGSLSGQPVQVGATLASSPGRRALTGLDADIAGATATGDLVLLDAGLVTGILAVDVPELQRLARLALQDATGAFQANIDLSVAGEAQNVAIDGGARNVAAAGVTLGEADIDLEVVDAFGVPTLDGRANLRNLTAAGYDVRSADVTATRTGAATNVEIGADLGTGRLRAAGAFQRQGDGVSAQLSTFRLAQGDFAAELQRPTRVDLSGQTITVGRTAITVGDGSLVVEGRIADDLDLTATIDALPLRIANLIRPDLAVEGTVSGTVDVGGTRAAPTATAEIEASGVSAAPLAERGIDPLTLIARGSYAEGTATIETFETSVGGGTITASGVVGEALDVTVEIARLPLALANAAVPDLDVSGSLSGSVRATGSLTAPNGSFDIAVVDAAAAPLRASNLEPLDGTARGSIAGRMVTIDALETTVGGGRITASGAVGEVLDLTVGVADLPLALANAAVPGFDIAGTLSADAAVTGSLRSPSATFDVRVAGASATPLRQSGVGTIDAAVAGTFANGTATLSTARAKLGGGVIEARGSVGDRLDLVADIDRLPLGVANGFVPDLGVGGVLSGRVTATGSLAAPRVEFEIAAPQVTARPISAIGLPPAAVAANGTFAAGTVTLREATVRVGPGLISARGAVGRTVDVAADITNFPVALANGVQPGLGLGGTLSGSARATGTATDPRGEFRLAVAGLTAAPLANAGVGPLRVDASGSFADRTARIASATVAGGGLDVAASGTVPLQGGGLDVRINATAPFAIANGFLVQRAATVSGTVAANVAVTGSLQRPAFSGSVRSGGFEFRDPLTNLTLADGALAATLSGDRVTINQLSARLGDGTVGVTGSVGLTNGFPADLRITADNARYADGKLIAVTFSAGLGITGPLTGTPSVTGRVDIDRAEISVPTRLSGTAALLEVYHVATPPDVLETLRRAEAGPFADRGGDQTGANASGLTLDVTVSAPRRIFIRGRGIDAELGGEVRVTGPISDVAPVGQFNLIRGRINILTQRIDITEGVITLTGDLDPTVRLVAETRTKEVTARVIVEGIVSDPEIRFESDPQLPQDEVLAQLIFGRSIEDLSPFQLAQLAAAVGELAGGGGGPNLIEQVRIFSGLDNLDIVTSPGGGTSVQAGRYVSENLYLGVQAGESSGVTLNLDVNRNVKIRAEALTNESSLGIFYEREY